MSKVAYVLGCYPSASETFIRREIEELRRMGVEVTVMSLRRPAEPEAGVVYRSPLLSASTAKVLLSALLRPVGLIQALAVPICLLGRPVEMLRTLRNLVAALEFTGVMRQRGIDHVHAHFANMPATVGLMIAAFSDARFSFTAHARDLYIRPALLAPKLAAAHRAVGCTEFNRSLLARGVPWAVARRIVAVHHGIDATYFTEGNATRPEPPLVLAAGRLVAKKGFDVLIGACARLRRDGVEFRCEIAGDGPLREALEQRIRANALASTVRLIGQQSQGQLRELYRTATVLAMPCVVGPDGDHDGLPNVLLEAAGCGAALVSTPVGGVTELIRDGETGLLAAPGSADELADAIRHLLSDPDLRGRLAAAARCEVEQHFNIQTNVRRLAEVLGLLPAAAKS